MARIVSSFHIVKMAPAFKWLLFLAILLANLAFVLMWLVLLLNAFTKEMVQKCPRLFICFCLCGRAHKFKALKHHVEIRDSLEQRHEEVILISKDFEKLFEQAYLTENTATINAIEALMRQLKKDLSTFRDAEISTSKEIMVSRFPKQIEDPDNSPALASYFNEAVPPSSETSSPFVDFTSIHTISEERPPLRRLKPVNSPKQPLRKPVLKEAFATIED